MWESVFVVLVVAVVAVAITACVGMCMRPTPDVTFTYYAVKWKVVVTVTQTLRCNDSKTCLVVANTPSLTTSYFSDSDRSFQINIKDLKSRFADAELTMTFTDDGRLKTINVSTTGQGDAIVKSALALATAVASFPILPPRAMTVAPIETACDIINKWGAGKPVTLNYTATINSANLGKPVQLEPTRESEELYSRLYSLLKDSMSKPVVSVSEAIDNKSGPSFQAPPAEAAKHVGLELQKTRFADLTIEVGGRRIGDARIVIPDETVTYELPIPKAAFFRKQTFTLTLSDAGAVTSVGYLNTTGTAGALNALGAIATPGTAAARAADLKAQADLIDQQQRLVQCQVKPD